MDNLRGNFGALDASDLGPGLDSLGLEPVIEDDQTEDVTDHTPPPVIGTDERRMQVRAYNFWASLLDNRSFPSIEDLDPDALPDFGPNSVLLDFSCGIDNPEVSYLGDALAAECDTDLSTISKLSDVPARSLLSRITDHYMQIIANQAPIGFEAEFVNQRGATILYRGILLPFSSDDDTIDFIYGVINWKELAESETADELLLEVDQALDTPEEPRGSEDTDLVDWADGPVSDGPVSDSPVSDSPVSDSPVSGSPVVDSQSADDHFDGIDAGMNVFDMDASMEEPLELTHPVSDLVASGIAVPQASDAADMALADWLAVAREMAQTAKSSEERTRASLYEAVSHAYDFAIAAMEAPEDFAELLSDAGLTMQDRAPMTPVVKLVFGVDYDKTRLTEYAAVLSWAKRNQVDRGALATFLMTAEGGLKGIIAAERDFRRETDGTAPVAKKPRGPKKAIARKLRAIEPRQFETLENDGEEFALVMIRRTEEGDVVMLGEVPGNTSLIEKAARELLD